MKLLFCFCAVMVSTFINCQAQSNNETVIAIEDFVTHFSGSASIKHSLYFCISYLPTELQQNLPTKVAGFNCIYYSNIDKNKKMYKKILKRNPNGCYYTIEVLTSSRDTVDFLFTQVKVQREQNDFSVYAECRGTLPITPDIRVINASGGKRIVQSRIIDISNTGIKRDIVLH